MSDNNDILCNNPTNKRRMAVSIEQGRPSVLSCDSAGTSLDTIDVDRTISDEAKILEEVVYSRPQMLNESGLITIISGSDRFLVIPAEIAGDQEAVKAVMHTFRGTESDNSDYIVSPTEADVAVVHRPDGDIAGYAARTFAKTVIVHRMSAMIDLCARQSRPVKDVKMHIFVNDGHNIDIIAFGAQSLLLANSFKCRNDDDCFYFIAAAAKDCNFDQVDDEMVIYTASDCRNDLVERLRQFYNSVTKTTAGGESTDIPWHLHTFIYK